MEMVVSAVVTGDSGGRRGGSVYLQAQIPLRWGAWTRWSSLLVLLVPAALCGV